MTRALFVCLIREVVRGWPVQDVVTYAEVLPAGVRYGAQQFCEDNDLGQWFYLQIRGHNISVAGELYRFIEENRPPTDNSKGGDTPGDTSNATT